MKKFFCVFAAAAAVLTILSGCIENNQTNIEEKDAPQIFSVKAIKADAMTKALGFEGNNITATWADGESVQVFKGDVNLGTIYPTTYGTSTTTLEGQIASGVTGGDVLTLVFNSNDYTNQDGTLAYIAANCDYATASVTVAPRVAGDPVTTTEPANFVNQQAIVKFTLQDYDGSALNASALTIQCGTRTLSLSGLSDIYDPTVNGPGVVYVAIPGFSAQEVTLTATYGGKEYVYKKSGVTFTNGKYHRVSVKLFNELTTPLTFEAVAAGTTIMFTKGYYSDAFENKVQYSTDGSTWTTYNSGDGITLTAVGDKVMFRGTMTRYGKYIDDSYLGSIFTCDKDCYVYGNVMSLIGGENFVNTVSFTEDCAFKDLFKENTHIKNHLYKILALPATTLTKGCYKNMFKGCTGLTEAPALPATTVYESSYEGMFMDCSNLVSVPASLPALTLYSSDGYSTNNAKSCYCSMFENCTSLTTAPSLPATTLANQCYQRMFFGCSSLSSAPVKLPALTVPEKSYEQMFFECTSLITAPELLATSVGKSAYEFMFCDCTSLTTVPVFSAQSVGYDSCRYMFSGCTSLNSFPATLPAMTLGYGCYEGMFSGCTSLKSAPSLPAENLAQRCYLWMFNGCKNLTTAPESLPATVLANQCYEMMFYNCESLTTAPNLPALTVAESCYESMFSGCKELISVPATLPATDLTGASRCYSGMFTGCSKLESAPSLPAMTLESQCYNAMFSGCTKLATAPELPATTLATNCYSEMFSNCKALTKSPILPAAVMVTNCYSSMFSSCSNLSEVTCLATSIDPESTNCTSGWLYGVANSGTLKTPASAADLWTAGTSGIPSGWTRVDYVAPQP